MVVRHSFKTPQQNKVAKGEAVDVGLSPRTPEGDYDITKLWQGARLTTAMRNSACGFGLSESLQWSVWRKRENGKTETRTVVDRTYGGDLVVVIGRVARFSPSLMIGQTDWNKWVVGAKKIKEGKKQ